MQVESLAYLMKKLLFMELLGVVLFGAAAPLAGWLADKFSRAILITIYPFGLSLGAFLASMSQSTEMLGLSLGVLGFFAAINTKKMKKIFLLALLAPLFIFSQNNPNWDIGKQIDGKQRMEWQKNLRWLFQKRLKNSIILKKQEF